jgi:dienelactone hydrolase
MAEVLLFHHAHGLTSGVRDFAERLWHAGHIVHVPDLYEGRVFDDLNEGVAYAQEAGILERGRAAAKACPANLSTPGSHSTSCRHRC